ncbi:MAG: GNAT family N-acetyltransferase, partial [Flavobacteriaceae bacterium]
MKVEKATDKDISTIKKLTEACARDMISKGIFQWNEHYPSRAVFEKDVERGELFKLVEAGQIRGIMVLSDIEDPEYDGVKWSGEEGRKIYVHRLAVHPEHQGKGYAQKLMEFAQVFAVNEGFSWIRLDTFSQNKRNNIFYQ